MTPIFFFPSEGNKKCVHGLSGRKYWGRSAGGNPIGLSASSAAGALAWAWCWPGPSVSAREASPRRRLGTRSARRSSREAPPGSRGLHPPLFHSLPSAVPWGEQAGRYATRLGGGGVVCVLREKSSAAPEWRPRVINKLRFYPDATTATGRRIGKAWGGGWPAGARARAQAGPRRRAEGGGRAENNAHWVKTHLYTNLRENFPTIPSSDHHAPGQETAARPPSPATRIVALRPAPSLHWTVITSLTRRFLLAIGSNLGDAKEDGLIHAPLPDVSLAWPYSQRLSGLPKVRNQSSCFWLVDRTAHPSATTPLWQVNYAYSGAPAGGAILWRGREAGPCD